MATARNVVLEKTGKIHDLSGNATKFQWLYSTHNLYRASEQFLIFNLVYDSIRFRLVFIDFLEPERRTLKRKSVFDSLTLSPIGGIV